MQKTFDNSSVETVERHKTLSGGPRFTDDTIPATPLRTTATTAKTIRQASASNVPSSVFDSPFPVTAPDASPAYASPAYAGQAFGPPAGASFNQYQYPPSENTHPYFPNIGGGVNASQLTMGGTNFPQGMYQQGTAWNGQSGYGTGFGPGYGQPAMGMGNFMPPAGSSYPSAYPSMSPSMGGQGQFASPYGLGGMGAGAYSNFGGQNPIQNPMLLQAMLQQEAIRHEVALEAEEEEERLRLEEEEREAAAARWSMRRLMPVQVSSPLGETLWSCVKTMSVFNTPTGPDRGVGMPLATRSWLDRPYYGGLFVGSVSGSQLVSGMIDQRNGSTGGAVLGYNINEYWGLESRVHFTAIDIRETAAGRVAYESWYRANNPAAAFIPPLSSRSNSLTILDLSVHYYPLGNAKFRPFFKYGIGYAHGSFKDTYGVGQKVDSMAMPLGLGLRYWWNERLAVQTDIIDNIIFSSGVAKTQNNWAFTIGLTYSFGTSKKRRPVPYWPYTPSTGSKW